MTATQWGIWAWGVGGVVLFLANPIVRLGAQTLDGFAQGLDPLQWAITVVWCGAMFYAEGIRGFHRQFSPRVVVRAEALARRPFGLPTLLAPFTCMGLLHATRKRLIVSWTLLVFIVLLVVGV
ncbi:MAG: hypothetical protein R3F61_29745 [Myxococcota bacterium]